MPTDKQRRQAERRRMQRQLQRRRERDQARRQRNLIISIVGAVVVIGLVVFFIVQTSSDDKKTTTADKKATSATSSAASSSPAASSSTSLAAKIYPCTWTKTSAPAAKKASVPPTTKPPRSGTTDVTLATSRGTLKFALNRKIAPCAVESFVSLAEQKYFNSTPCHRLTTTGIYVLQCGDPSGTGSGGPGYSFDDELSTAKYTRGTLAMANSGANTNGSQFFIVYKDSITLPPNYTIFGTVTSGLSVVDKVAAKGAVTAGDGKPKLPISIEKVTVAG